jgi:hypothetical protein
MHDNALRVHDALVGHLLHSIKIQMPFYGLMPVPGQPELIVVGFSRRGGDDVHLFDIETGACLLNSK